MLTLVHGEFVEILYAFVDVQDFSEGASETPIIDVRPFTDFELPKYS